MLLVILGAGASHDSVDIPSAMDPSHQRNRMWQPPLAQDLFSPRENFGKLLDKYPDVRGLAVHLRKVLTQQDVLLERELDKVQERANSADRRAASQLMAVRHYLQEVLWNCGTEWFAAAHGCTNYHYLLDRLAQWVEQHSESVVFVSFNYDTLLERAMLDELKMPMTSLEKYVSDERFRLFKLHGSVNWAHHMAFGTPPELNERDHVMQNAIELAIPSEFQIRCAHQGAGDPVSDANSTGLGRVHTTLPIWV